MARFDEPKRGKLTLKNAKNEKNNSSIPAQPVNKYLNPINPKAFSTSYVESPVSSSQRPVSSSEIRAKVDAAIAKRDTIVKSGPLMDVAKNKKIKNSVYKNRNNGKPLAN